MDELDDNNDKDAKKNINDNKVPTIKVSYLVLRNSPRHAFATLCIDLYGNSVSWMCGQ